MTTKRTRRWTATTAGLTLAGVSCLLASGGCNLIGGAFVALHGPPKVPAVYEPDEERTTVVFIDDLNNEFPRRRLRDLAGDVADAEMLGAGVVAEGKLISADSARRAISNETSTDRLSAVDVGAKVGAEVVIWVTMTGWTLQRRPGLIEPTVTAEVRVVDAVTNQRIWPPGSRPYDFRSEFPRSTGEIQNSAERTRFEELLARRVGSDIAKLFYTHERERISDQRRALQ